MTASRMETVRCGKCSHEQPRRLVKCLYCGGDLAPDGAVPARDCPVCKTAMETVPVGWVLIDRCGTCRGEFYDTGELERVKGLSDADARWLRETELPREAAAARLCPACKIRMDTVQLGYGVIVESCTRCRGVWCDRGEAERLGAAVRDRHENKGLALDVAQEAEDAAWTIGLVGDLAFDSVLGGNRTGVRLAREMTRRHREEAAFQERLREEERREVPAARRGPEPASGPWDGDPIPRDWKPPPKKPGAR